MTGLGEALVRSARAAAGIARAARCSRRSPAAPIPRPSSARLPRLRGTRARPSRVRRGPWDPPRGYRCRRLAFLHALCAQLGVPLVEKTVARGECARQARASKRSLEEAARDLRHALLREAPRAAGRRSSRWGTPRTTSWKRSSCASCRGPTCTGCAGSPRAGARSSGRCSAARGRRSGPTSRPSASPGGRTSPTGHELPAQQGASPAPSAPGRGVPRLPAGPAGPVAEDLPCQRPGPPAGSSAAWSPRERDTPFDAADFLEAPPAVRAWSLMSLYDRFRVPGAPRRLPWRFLAPALRRRVPGGRNAPEGPRRAAGGRDGRLRGVPFLPPDTKRDTL